MKILKIFGVALMLLMSCGGMNQNEKTLKEIVKTIDDAQKGGDGFYAIVGPRGSVKYEYFMSAESPDLGYINVTLTNNHNPEYKKLMIQFLINVKTKATNISAYEVNDKPVSMMDGVWGLTLMALESNRGSTPLF